MPLSTVDVAGVPSDRLRHVGTQVLRTVLALLWLGWAVLAWWSAPRPADADRARADIAAGSVVGFARVGGWQADRGFWGSTRSPRFQSDGMSLWWETTDGRVHYAAPDVDMSPEQLRGFGGTGDGVKVTALADEMRAAGRSEGSSIFPFGSMADIAAGLAAAVAITGLLMVVFGPMPVRGTRPFWFWIGLFPLGLGALAWLAVEHPWSRRASDRAAGAKRRSGLDGFWILLVGAIAVNFALYGLRTVLPVSVIP